MYNAGALRCAHPASSTHSWGWLPGQRLKWPGQYDTKLGNRHLRRHPRVSVLSTGPQPATPVSVFLTNVPPCVPQSTSLQPYLAHPLSQEGIWLYPSPEPVSHYRDTHRHTGIQTQTEIQRQTHRQTQTHTLICVSELTRTILGYHVVSGLGHAVQQKPQAGLCVDVSFSHLGYIRIPGPGRVSEW